MPCREPQSVHSSKPVRGLTKPHVGNSNLRASGSMRRRVKGEPMNTGIEVRDDAKPLDLSNNTGKRNSQVAVIALSDDSNDVNTGDQAARARIKVCLQLYMQSKRFI
jgi:hypothetical protein